MTRNYVRELLEEAKSQGMTFIVFYDAETVDYTGDDIDEAMIAIEACDEMQVSFRAEGETTGWAMIVNGLEPDEQIADGSGVWLTTWCEVNVR